MPTPPAHINLLRGAQGQLVCTTCQNILMYPARVMSVCCAVCSTITTVPAPGNKLLSRHVLMYLYKEIDNVMLWEVEGKVYTILWSDKTIITNIGNGLQRLGKFSIPLGVARCCDDELPAIWCPHWPHPFFPRSTIAAHIARRRWRWWWRVLKEGRRWWRIDGLDVH